MQIASKGRKIMNSANIDLSVALIFFTRTVTLAKVFERIKEVKPSRLFLIQDGPRANVPSDIVNIKKCREIVENIDWECTVFKNYAEENLGCGRRPHTGISWVFEHTDQAVIIEDDCVVEKSFFSFCKEMLSKYQEDERVGMISSWNHLGKYDFGGASYGFSKVAGCGAWATWKSRWDKCRYNLDYLTPYLESCLLQDITPSYVAKKKVKKWKEAQKEIHMGKNISYWDHQWNCVRCLNSWLSITPKYNQMQNIGDGAGGTHFGKTLPKRIQKIFNMQTFDLEFPLTHTTTVIDDRNYDKQCFKILYPNKLQLMISKIKQKLFR